MKDNYYNLAYVNKLLSENKSFPKKHYGQNFLIDKNIVNKIVQSIDIKDQTIVEIGPGIGSLTRAILSSLPKEIFAYEIDKNMCTILNNEIDDDKLLIINEDFMKANLDKFNNAILIGNLPYYITSKIIFKAINTIRQWKAIVFMVQKEVFERIVAKPNTKNYSKLSATIKMYFDFEHILDAGPNVFFPKPNVNSSVIKMIPKTDIPNDAENISKFIKLSFQMKRKTLVNNLKSIYDIDKIHSALKKMNINLLCRPQSLSTKLFIELFMILNAH